jgi:LysR family transcriptional activator of nhaA
MEWLNFHHLRYFWMVAREGSLRLAAERLSVSQPSISAQVRLLEEALGETLFQRTGRRLTLTETGRSVFSYADEIFSLGRELLGVVKQAPGERPMRFQLGIVDSLPKLVAHRVLRPVFQLTPPVHLICREGKLGELLAQLAAHRLDLVLADEPAASLTQYRLFNHPLGSSEVAFFATPKLANRLRRGFPASLSGAPAFLPTDNTALRMAIDRWFDANGISPKVVAEFEDSALMKAVAMEGESFFPAHLAAREEVTGQYGFKLVGIASDCRTQFHAISAERRIRHPAIATITASAPDALKH